MFLNTVLCPRCNFNVEALLDDGVCSWCQYRTPAGTRAFRKRRNNPFAALPVPLRLNADPRFTGDGITIAFIDSGFSLHPELMKPRKRILAITDATDDRVSRRYFHHPHPESWHGTMSSVLSAGNGLLSRGFYRAIAPDADVVLVKTMGVKKHGVSGESIAWGVRWAIDNKQRYNIRIINLAVGADEPEPLSNSSVDQAVEDAVREGMVVVSASGNTPCGSVLPPASAPSAITVGGYNDGNQLSTKRFSWYPSTYGLTLNGDVKPDILAPAFGIPGPILPRTDQFRESELLFQILSATKAAGVHLLDQHQNIFPDLPKLTTASGLRAWARKRIITMKYVGPYLKSMEGSSVAAAIVSSVVAQMLEAQPGLQPGSVRSMLREAAVPFENVPADRQGAGILNARGAVELALLSRHPAAAPGVHRSEDFIAFMYRNPSAQSVFFAGDVNGWNPRQAPFQRLAAGGLWSCILPKPPVGQHRYKFVVDGTRWMADPSNDLKEPDGYGDWNSILVV